MTSPPKGVFTRKWRPVGPGGGGTGIWPAVSPHDKSVVFSASDMQGFYRSDDCGSTWKVFDGMKIRAISCRLAFHPTDPNVIYAGILGAVMKSTDGGFNWQKVFGRVGRVSVDIPRGILIDPRSSDTIYAAVDHMDQKPQAFIAKSTDAGATWGEIARWPAPMAIWRLFVEKATGHMYAAATCVDWYFTHAPTAGVPGLYRSKDGGTTWELVATPEGRFLDAILVEKAGRTLVYVLMRAEIRGDKVIGGLYRSDDGCSTWRDLNSAFDMSVGFNNRAKRPAPKMEFNTFAISESNPDIMYVPVNRHGPEPEWMTLIYKSTDGGDSFVISLNSDPAAGPVNYKAAWLPQSVGWWWGGRVNSITVAPKDPDIVFFTDDGQIMRTLDGGRTWEPAYSKVKSGKRGQSVGWEVTNCYTYNVDPFDAKTHFITYTDTGLFKSTDGGRTWQWAAGKTAEEAPWRGNFYHIVFDPEVKGRIWGAATPVHDLPHWKMLQGDPSNWPGTVVLSEDSGESWNECAQSGLAQAPCTHITLDPKSPRDSRTLYAAMFTKGVYKSTDGGRSWVAKNKGLGFNDNLNVWQVMMLPNGTLIAAVSAARKGDRVLPGGLFRSSDGADSWEFVNEERPIPYPFGLACHPTDSNIFYAACCDLPVWFGEGLRNRVDDHLPLQPMTACEDASLGGGLYRTTDGGKTWRRVLAVWNCYSPAVDPNNANVVYAACFDVGVYRTADGGEKWKRLEGLPFVNVNHVSFDPNDPKRIYALTCGGGVWTRRM